LAGAGLPFFRVNIKAVALLKKLILQGDFELGGNNKRIEAPLTKVP
jgi:hypothetical protein